MKKVEDRYGGYSRGNAAILVGNLPGRKKLSLLVREIGRASCRERV